MRSYKITHIVLCEVETYRVINAENEEDLFKKIAAIQTLTDTGDGSDYQIIGDVAVKQINIRSLDV